MYQYLKQLPAVTERPRSGCINIQLRPRVASRANHRRAVPSLATEHYYPKTCVGPRDAPPAPPGADPTHARRSGVAARLAVRGRNAGAAEHLLARRQTRMPECVPRSDLADIRADVAGGPVEAVGVHELLPGERERLQEEGVVEGEVRHDGAQRLRVVGDAVLRHLGAVLEQQQVALLHEDLLALRLELQLRVEDAVELKHLPLLRREHAEVLVRVRARVGEGVVRPGARVAHGALLVGRAHAALQRDELAEGEPRHPPALLTDPTRHVALQQQEAARP